MHKDVDFYIKTEGINLDVDYLNIPNYVQYLDGIEKFLNCVTLHLHCNIRDYEDIAKLKMMNNLENLFISLNHIVSFDQIELPENIKYLRIHTNSLINLDGIEKMKNLNTLIIEETNIKELNLKEFNWIQNLYLPDVFYDIGQIKQFKNNLWINVKLANFLLNSEHILELRLKRLNSLKITPYKKTAKYIKNIKKFL